MFTIRKNSISQQLSTMWKQMTHTGLWTIPKIYKVFFFHSDESQISSIPNNLSIKPMSSEKIRGHTMFCYVHKNGVVTDTAIECDCREILICTKLSKSRLRLCASRLRKVNTTTTQLQSKPPQVLIHLFCGDTPCRWPFFRSDTLLAANTPIRSWPQTTGIAKQIPMV